MKHTIKLIKSAICVTIFAAALGGVSPLYATQGEPQDPSNEAPLPLPVEPPTEENSLLPGPNDIENAPSPEEALTPDGYDPLDWWQWYEDMCWLFGADAANEMWQEIAPDPEPEPVTPPPPADNVPPGAKEAE